MAFIRKDNIEKVRKAQNELSFDEFRMWFGGLDHETAGFDDVFGGIVTEKMEEQLKELEENLAKTLKIPKDRLHVGGYAADAPLGLDNDAKVTGDPALERMAQKIAANSFYGNYWPDFDRISKNVWSAPVVADTDKIMSILPSELTA